jgi:hypothetical protein
LDINATLRGFAFRSLARDLVRVWVAFANLEDAVRSEPCQVFGTRSGRLAGHLADGRETGDYEAVFDAHFTLTALILAHHAIVLFG